MRQHVILAVLQLLLVLGFAFGDIGFDNPGRYGLDFGDGLLILAVFCRPLGVGHRRRDSSKDPPVGDGSGPDPGLRRLAVFRRRRVMDPARTLRSERSAEK